MTVSRRSFLKSTSAAAAVTLSGGLAGAVSAQSATFKPGPGNKYPGRVVINFNRNAVEGVQDPVPEVIKKMVDDSIMLLTEKPTVGEAWKELFPDTLSLQSKIAIKTNTANVNLPTVHWASVQAMTDGLKRMNFDRTKFPADNIVIYDMDFFDGMSKTGFTQENFPDIGLVRTEMVDGGDGALNNHKYAGALRDADFLINVFSPRGHSSEYLPQGSRFTLGFKSHVGTYAADYREEGPSLHAELPNNIKEISCTGVVYNKNVLSMCSGIFAKNEGNGPPGDAENYVTYAKTMDASITGSVHNSTTIMLSTDPVAIEMQSIKMMRINKGGGYSIDDMPPYLQASAGISGRMQGETRNVGIIDEEEMDIRRVINGKTAVDPLPLRGEAGRDAISVIPRQDATFFDFTVPARCIGKRSAVEIVALDGSTVYRKYLPLRGIRNHFSWNNRRSGGGAVSRGMYVVRITAGTFRKSRKFTLH